MTAAVLGRRAVGQPVDGDAPQEQVEVVLVGDADAAVQLHAVLDELGEVVADVGLGRADRAGGRVVLLVVPGRDVGDRVTRFEPHLHVGEAVLDLLIRRQRPAEGVPVERPVEREVERDLRRAHHLRALHHAGELQLVLDVGGRGAGLADERTRGTRAPSNWMRA